MTGPRPQPSEPPSDEDPLAQAFDAWLAQLGEDRPAPQDPAATERPTARLGPAPTPKDELRHRLARLIAIKEQHLSHWEGYLPPAQLAAWKEELEELRALQVLARRLD